MSSLIFLFHQIFIRDQLPFARFMLHISILLLSSCRTHRMSLAHGKNLNYGVPKGWLWYRLRNVSKIRKVSKSKVSSFPRKLTWSKETNENMYTTETNFIEFETKKTYTHKTFPIPWNLQSFTSFRFVASEALFVYFQSVEQQN